MWRESGSGQNAGICLDAVDPLIAVGMQDPNVGKGDQGCVARRFTNERCTRIAIIQASVLDARNRPRAVPRRLWQQTLAVAVNDWRQLMDEIDAKRLPPPTHSRGSSARTS